MGDSDDDFSNRRRDKFRRERNDYDRRDRPWEDRYGIDVCVKVKGVTMFGNV